MKLSENDSLLIEAAFEAMKHSYSPYSEFKVGAAVRTTKGEVFAACNVENASYGLSICAERAAIFRMVSAGPRKIDALAVVNPARKIVTPCGACRQVVREFASGSCKIICSSNYRVKIFTLDKLLPASFEPSDLSE